MKTQFLLISFLFLFAWSVQAQVQRRKATLPSGRERVGNYFNQPQPGFKPNHMVVPAKRNMFDSSGYVWKWDTIFCYNIASGASPFQRATRTYNSFGEQLTILYERRQGSLAWENYAREADAYDSAGNWVYQLQEVWQNNAWVNFQKQEFVFDANGNMVDWKRFMWVSTYWATMWHYSWHFDANGLNDTCIYQHGQDSIWINHWLGLSMYDANGYLSTALTNTWINNAWEVTNLDTYTNDSTGNCLTILQQDWENSSWVNRNFYTAIYDTAGNCSSSLSQQWQNNAWENWSLYSFLYDANGNTVVNLYQIWTNGAWANSGRQLYVYDNSNNMLSYTSQTPENSSWRNQDSEQYTYDAMGNSLTGKYMHSYGGWHLYDGTLEVFANHERDMVLQGEMCRYEAVLDSIMVFTDPGPSQGQISLYPNPAQSMIYISSPNVSNGSHGSLTLYDLRGQLIITKQVEKETTGMDVSALKPGVYFVRFSDNRMTRVLKFVKD